MANATVAPDLPPLPAYDTRPMPDLLPFISDFWLSLIAPHIAYWVVSLIFHVIDVYDLFPQYRLHTPDEIAQRNLASRYEVARDVLLEQLIQIATSAVLTLTEPRQTTGAEARDVAVWATRIRLAQRALPSMLGLVGLNAAAISKNMAASHPLLAGALAGGHYPFLTTTLDDVTGAAVSVPAFAAWELLLAKAIYWVLVPGFQLWLAACILDAWQYFWHRAMHLNKWMYSTSYPLSPTHLPSLKPLLTVSPKKPTGTPATTGSTCPTPTARSTTTPSRASCSTRSAPGWPTSSPSSASASASSFLWRARSRRSTTTAGTRCHGIPCST
jgi:sphinganine C4-monooxygenase